MTQVLKLLALIFSSGFSAGLLVTSFVFVPGWRDMEATKAVDWFSQHGLILGFVMLPMGVLALLFFFAAAIATYRMNGAGFQSYIWTLAFLAAFGSMVLLVTYFAGANVLFFENQIEAGAVYDEIDRWGFWNWVRTVFSVLATAFAFYGTVKDWR